MLKKQKPIIIFITVYLLVTIAIGLILVLVKNRNDLFPITMIVSTVGFLLFLNIRASHYSKLKYMKKQAREEMDKEVVEKHNTATKILLIFFVIMCIISLVTAITIH